MLCNLNYVKILIISLDFKLKKMSYLITFKSKDREL